MWINDAGYRSYYCGLTVRCLLDELAAELHEALEHRHRLRVARRHDAAVGDAAQEPVERRARDQRLRINDAGHRSYYCGLTMLATVQIIVD